MFAVFVIVGTQDEEKDGALVVVGLVVGVLTVCEGAGAMAKPLQNTSISETNL